MDSIGETDIQSLIEYFSKTMYRAKYSDEMVSIAIQKLLTIHGLGKLVLVYFFMFIQ